MEQIVERSDVFSGLRLVQEGERFRAADVQDATQVSFERRMVSPCPPRLFVILVELGHVRFVQAVRLEFAERVVSADDRVELLQSLGANRVGLLEEDAQHVDRLVTTRFRRGALPDVKTVLVSKHDAAPYRGFRAKVGVHDLALFVGAVPARAAYVVGDRSALIPLAAVAGRRVQAQLGRGRQHCRHGIKDGRLARTRRAGDKQPSPIDGEALETVESPPIRHVHPSKAPLSQVRHAFNGVNGRRHGTLLGSERLSALV